MFDTAVLLAAAFVAGALNAVAGGGSFLTLPALVLTGVPPVMANATGTVALLPGYLASAWGFREDLQAPPGLSLRRLLALSLLGGALGAALLLLTSDAAFRRIVPWLLLAVAAYGGYFNGGLGILLLALFGLLGQTNLHAMNGVKTLVSAMLTAIAVLLYAAGGLVLWEQALLMMVAATLGGYGGARVARRIPAPWLRAGIVATGLVMAGLFFWRQ
ncbi:MAG: sulfite exporter TauE/SafE family protein [Comamonadaceae bacterium]|nr:MAG: sulfite exporter TauE/SafE family protein [Comamonadaceae bacterium]